MNKYRQCMYTVMLILTCLVASPFIFKQIWESSSVKKPKAPPKEPTVSAVETTSEAEPETEQPAETDAEQTEPSETAEEPETELTTQESAGFTQSDSSYFDDALFIGDSRTVGIKEYGTLKNADYFCSVGLAAYKIGTETVDGRTLSDVLNSNEYGKIYIMLGINEVANDTEYTITQFRSLLDTVRKYQPDAVIYLEGNLHVTAAAQTQNITNEGINALNARLSELANENDGVYFININEVFDDETGALTPDFTSDGIHVLGKYYETWCNWFCQNTVSDGSAQATTAAAETTTAANYEVYTEQYYDNNSYDDSYSDNSYYDSSDDDSDNNYNDEY